MAVDDFNQDSPVSPLAPFNWAGSDASPRASLAGDVITAMAGLEVIVAMLETSEIEGHNILDHYQRGGLYRAAVYISRSLNEHAERILQYEMEQKASQVRSAQ